MTCDEIQESLSAMLDGVLPVEERTKVEEHLGSCAACRVRRAELADVRGLLRSLEDVESPVSPRLAKEITKAVRRAQSPTRGRFLAATVAIVLMAGVVLLVLVWSALRLLHARSASASQAPAPPVVVGDTPAAEPLDAWEIEVWATEAATCSLARAAFEDLAQDLRSVPFAPVDGLQGVRVTFKARTRDAEKVAERFSRFQADHAGTLRRARSSSQR